EDAGGHSRTGLSPLTAIRNPRSPDYLHAPVRQEIIPPERAHPSQRSRSRCPFVGCWREAPPAGGAGTERYLIRFLVGPEYMGRAGANRDQQPLANQGTNRGTHPGEVPAVRLKAEAYLCTAAYLRPHHGAGGFRTAAQIPR